MLSFLLNVLWFVLGGLVMGLGWWLAGVLCAITIVGLPWARACFVIGSFSFWPFGQEAISRRELTGQVDLGTGPLGLVGNVVWFLVAGWWLAIGHLTSALACFISIIGIPFGIQHIKLALIALAPIGLQVVPKRQRRYHCSIRTSWPTMPLPVSSSPIRAAAKPTMAVRPLSNSTPCRALAFQGLAVVMLSPKRSTGS